MKKQKIVLMVIMFLGICGGAFAFHLTHRSGNFICATSSTSACNIRANTTTNLGAPIMWCTDVVAEPCILKFHANVNQ